MKLVIPKKELNDYLKNGGTSATVQFERMGKNVSAVFFAGNIPSVRNFNTFPEEDWPILPQLLVVMTTGWSAQALLGTLIFYLTVFIIFSLVSYGRKPSRCA